MTKLEFRISLLILFLCLAPVPLNAQTGNLLQNPDADLEAQHWQAFGQAVIEEVNSNRHFVVRNGGNFLQDVILPEGAVGQYAVLIGRGSSERINPDGAITGLPYLYGFMMTPDGRRILAYLQGQRMRSSATVVDEWVKMWGIFRVPQGTGRISFFLRQALRSDIPHDGSAARFDDLGLYLFPSEAEAKTFIDNYN